MRWVPPAPVDDGSVTLDFTAAGDDANAGMGEFTFNLELDGAPVGGPRTTTGRVANLMDLASGTYTVVMAQDEDNCPVPNVMFTIDAGDPCNGLSGAPTLVMASGQTMAGADDGTLEYSIDYTGNVGTTTYEIFAQGTTVTTTLSGAAPEAVAPATNTITGIPVGGYTIRFTNENNCDLGEFDFAINPAPTMQDSVPVVADSTALICVTPNVPGTPTTFSQCDPLDTDGTAENFDLGTLCFEYTAPTGGFGLDTVCTIVCDENMVCDTIRTPIVVSLPPNVMEDDTMRITPGDTMTVCADVTRLPGAVHHDDELLRR